MADNNPNNAADDVQALLRAGLPPQLPKTDFAQVLTARFGTETALQVLKRMEDMQIPAPKTRAEFMASTDGVLVFSNETGIVLRVEATDGNGYNSSVRAKSAWVLEPLGSVKLPGACMEICPGVHYEGSDVAGRQLYWKLNSDGYHFWDERIDNMGRLPPTPLAPEGTSIVIDRMSVNQLNVGADAARRALLNGLSVVNPLDDHLKQEMGRQNPLNFRSPVQDPKARFADVVAEFKQMGIELTTRRSATENLTLENNPQELLYGGLRRAFQEAWPDPSVSPDPAKMENFWQQVREAKTEGRLVAGWNERPADGILNKTYGATINAENYGKIPYEIGTIAPDIALRDRMQLQTQNLMQYGVEHDLGHMKYSMLVTELSDGSKINMGYPNVGFKQDALEYQTRNGLTGLAQDYVPPYGTTPAEVANYVKVLQHQEARGLITPEQRLSSLTDVYNVLEARAPELKDLRFDRTSIPRIEEVVNGVAHGYNTKDIQFYVDGNRGWDFDEGLTSRLRGNGINPDTLGWVASPETLQNIDTQVQAIVDRRYAEIQADKAAKAAAAAHLEQMKIDHPLAMDDTVVRSANAGDVKPAQGPGGTAPVAGDVDIIPAEAPPKPAPAIHAEEPAAAAAVVPAAGGMTLMGKVNNALDGGMGAVGLVQGTMGAVRSYKEGDNVGVVVNGANAVTGGTAVAVSVARGLGHEVAPVLGNVIGKANIAVTVGTGIYQVATEKGNFIDTEADGSHNLGNKGERAVAVVATTATGIGLVAAGVGTAGVVPAVVAVAVVGDKAIEARRAWKDVDRQIAENGAPQRRDVTYTDTDGSPDVRKFRHIIPEMLEVSKDMRDSELPFKPRRDPRTGRINIDDMRKLALGEDPKFLAEFERVLDANIRKQQQIMKDNDSMLPKWLRFDDSVSRQTDAQMILADLQGAKTEFGWFKADQAAWDAQHRPSGSRFNTTPQQVPMDQAQPAQPTRLASTPPSPRG